MEQKNSEKSENNNNNLNDFSTKKMSIQAERYQARLIMTLSKLI